MPARHVVVDGSNIATEGSSLPTLKQLDEAVREFIKENPDDVVTVVVDATFGHRIPPEERQRFEEAELAGEVVSPPRGPSVGGMLSCSGWRTRWVPTYCRTTRSRSSTATTSGSLTRTVWSEVSPSPGWAGYSPPYPVRGPKSREAVKEAKRKKRADRPADTQ